jgi:hypothetical protein
MYLKYKMIFHDQDGQHSYVDLVMCLMVSRSGMPCFVLVLKVLVLSFNFYIFNIGIYRYKIQCSNSQHMQGSLMMTNIGRKM